MPKYLITLYQGRGPYIQYIAEDRPEWNDTSRSIAFCGWAGGTGGTPRRNFIIALGDSDTVIVESDAEDT